MAAKTKAVKRGENETRCGLCGFKPSDVRPSATFVCGICTPLGALGPDRRLKQTANVPRDELSAVRALLNDVAERARVAEARKYIVHRAGEAFGSLGTNDGDAEDRAISDAAAINARGGSYHFLGTVRDGVLVDIKCVETK